MLGGDRHFGQIVSAIATEWLSSATASIDAISTTIGTLPALVYRKTADGREEDESSALARLIATGPNEYQTMPDFMIWLVAETLRHGNGIAELIRDDAGTLVNIRPIPAEWGRGITLLPSGRLAYGFTEPTTHERRRLLDGEVLHLRDRSDDGLIGRARHERASPVIAAALALQKHAGSLFQNGMWLNAAIELDQDISQEGIDTLRAQLKMMFSGPENSGKAIILRRGKWHPLSSSPVDQKSFWLAALLAKKRRGCTVYRLIIGELTHGSFANVNDLLRYWAMGTVSQWARRIEAEFALSVFSGRRTHEVVIDLSGLLRGDPAQRWAGWKIAADTGVLTKNEIRIEEGYNRLPGGDAAPVSGAV